MKRQFSNEVLVKGTNRETADKVAALTRTRAGKDVLSVVHTVDVVEAPIGYALKVTYNEYAQPYDKAYYKGFVEGAVALHILG